MSIEIQYVETAFVFAKMGEGGFFAEKITHHPISCPTAGTFSLQNGQGSCLALRIRPADVLTFDTSFPGESDPAKPPPSVLHG